ncbi:MAG: linear amide C-N hydrolase [Candidatus Zixiibacteriota bacterium]
MNKTYLYYLIIMTLTILGLSAAAEEIKDLNFTVSPQPDSDTSRTLQSMLKIQGTGAFAQDGLYLMTHYGEYQQLYDKENREMIDRPLIDKTWRHCSVFSTFTENETFAGRNWDNQTVGSIIVSLCYPTNGYASIAFSRSIDIGFGHKDLLPLASSMFKDKFLLAPFYATDGINEHGLMVAVAGNSYTTVTPAEGKQCVYLTYLIRKILDGTKTVDEAIKLVMDYVPFDIDQNSLSSHLMVADASGQSVILEYNDNQWKSIYKDTTWQIMTTKPIFKVPDMELRENCWRYQSIAETFDKTAGKTDWKGALNILQDVSQIGTAWSVVYCLKSKELYFSVYKDWDTVYHLTFPSR